MKAITEAQRSCCYQKELHISWKRPEGGGKLVILNLNEGDFYSLEDSVSIEIWEQLLSGHPPAAILERLVSLYPEQDRGTLGEDLDQFLGELLENRLVCPSAKDGVNA